MNSKKTTQSGLFLIELIISIFFFILIAVVCTQLFIHAKTLSDNTINLNHSIMWLENISEVFLSQNGDYERTQCYFKEYIPENSNDIVIYYDKKWAVTSSINNAMYQLTATNTIINTDSGYYSVLDTYMYTVNDKKEIYSTTVKQFVAKGDLYGFK